jgi:hypothetical protein
MVSEAQIDIKFFCVNVRSSKLPSCTSITFTHMKWIPGHLPVLCVSCSRHHSLKNIQLETAFFQTISTLADTHTILPRALFVPLIIQSSLALASSCHGGSQDYPQDGVTLLPLRSMMIDSSLSPAHPTWWNPCSSSWPAPALPDLWPFSLLLWAKQNSRVSEPLHLLFSNRMMRQVCFPHLKKAHGLPLENSALSFCFLIQEKTIRPFLKLFTLQWEQGEGIWVGAVFLIAEINCKFLLDVKCRQTCL